MMERFEWPDNNLQPSPVEEPSEQEDHRYRTVGTITIIVIVAFGGVLVLLNSVAGGDILPSATVLATQSTPVQPDSGTVLSGFPPSRLVLTHTRPLDTIYTTDSVYLEVNLTRQNVTVHNRSGEAHTFRISSGTPAIREGIATPTGVFTVQNMTPMALSRQFNNARLHHWIGIQGGVGFHGLDGNGYYGYLGKRPSSHGCVRMAREEISDMYALVHPGALILVHYGYPARTIAFCESGDTLNARLIDSASVFNRNLGRERLQTLMDGKVWTDPEPRLVHLARQRLRWGMPVGDARRIPKQDIPEGVSFAATHRQLASTPNDIASTDIIRRNVGYAILTADSLDGIRRDSLRLSEQKEPEYGE
jgi:hypothetical protein